MKSALWIGPQQPGTRQQPTRLDPPHQQAAEHRSDGEEPVEAALYEPEPLLAEAEVVDQVVTREADDGATVVDSVCGSPPADGALRGMRDLRRVAERWET